MSEKGPLPSEDETGFGIPTQSNQRISDELVQRLVQLTGNPDLERLLQERTKLEQHATRLKKEIDEGQIALTEGKKRLGLMIWDETISATAAVAAIVEYSALALFLSDPKSLLMWGALVTNLSVGVISTITLHYNHKKGNQALDKV